METNALAEKPKTYYFLKVLDDNEQTISDFKNSYLFDNQKDVYKYIILKRIKYYKLWLYNLVDISTLRCECCGRKLETE